MVFTILHCTVKKCTWFRGDSLLQMCQVSTALQGALGSKWTTSIVRIPRGSQDSKLWVSLRLTLPMPDWFVMISTTYATSFAPPGCWPLRYQIFRRYVVQVLNGIDPDPAAQEMMLEQFVAEVPHIVSICMDLWWAWRAEWSACRVFFTS